MPTLPALALALLVASCPPADLRKEMASAAIPARGRVGAAALLVETGELVSLEGGGHFPMQSLYKAPIAMAVLRRVDAGRLRLDQKVRVEKSDLVPSMARSAIRDRFPEGGIEVPLSDLLRASVSDSDGTASDVLLRLTGAAEVTRMLQDMGIRGMVVATSETAMSGGERVQYRNWATPEAAVDFLRALLRNPGLTPASQALLLGWMTETETGPARIRGRLPAGTRVAHKTGTSGTRSGLTRATNDIGLITLPDGRHLALAVFVSDSPADEKVREGVIARIARAAWNCWAPAAPESR